ncbi:MAG TPA: hypothetical protein VK157_12920, partial [Phycisphaerales bacterium]|nr:hypothetical protein [Phycisphaerales bacterium]
VLHSDDGLDELTITAPVRVAEVDGASVREWVFDAREFGVERGEFAAIAARDFDEAVSIARRLLDGERGPMREMLVLASAAALVVGGAASEMRAGMEMARAALDSGKARETLARLAVVSQG